MSDGWGRLTLHRDRAGARGVTVGDSVEFSVYHAGSQACTPLHSWSGVRDHYLIHLVEAGRGVYTTGGASHALERGRCFVVRPGELVHYRADADSPWSYHWFAFGGRAADALADSAGIDETVDVIELDGESRIEDFLNAHRELCRELSQGPGRAYATTARLFDLMQLLHDAATLLDDRRPQAPPSGLYVQAVYDFVRRNYSRRTTVEEIAAYVGISRKYLSEVVRTQTGKTPRDILQEHRLQTARTLLITTGLPVGAIARSCGYSDPLLFSRQFSRLFGCSPRRFRQRHHDSASPDAGICD